jgi:hypothetical protein
MSVAMPQLMLPLLLAVEATKKGLLAFLQQMGMVVLSELLATEAAQIAGPKGKHIEGRTHHHWGTATTPVSFGGRHVSLPHPRGRAQTRAGQSVGLARNSFNSRGRAAGNRPGPSREVTFTGEARPVQVTRGYDAATVHGEIIG